MAITDATNQPPPRKSSATVSAKPAPAKPSAKTAERADALNGFGQLAQVPLLALRQYADAGAVGMYWPGVASEVAKLAESQEQVAKVIDPLIQLGPYTGLITAILPFALQIAVNHGRVAPGAMGTVPKSVLSAKVEASLANAELESLRQHLEAEKSSAAIREEIAANRRAMTDAMRDNQVAETGD
jgi:hypothetical protein